MTGQKSMRAVVADPAEVGILEVTDMPLPALSSGEALVRIEAFSINAGESRQARAPAQRYIPGWDFAGVIEEAGESGLAIGTRVVGVAAAGAWAQYVAAPVRNLASLPDNVGFAPAAALPVAGLTAMLCVAKGGDLSGKRVLVTGAAGGVGRYACQFANIAGARLAAVSRRDNLGDLLAADGVDGVDIFPDIEAACASTRYDFILESVGGSSLASALAALEPRGKVVCCGNSTGEQTSFDVRDMYLRGETELHGFYLGYLTTGSGCAASLAALVGHVSSGAIKVPLDREVGLEAMAESVNRLLARGVDGKLIIRPW